MTQPRRNSKGIFKCYDPERKKICLGNSKDNPMTETSIVTVTTASGESRNVFLDEISFTVSSTNYFIF